MRTEPKTQSLLQDERGGTVMTVLCTILGVLVILVGLIFVAMAFSFLFDGEEFGLIMFALVIALIAITSGGTLIALPHIMGRKKEGAPATGPSYAPIATKPGSDGPQVISRTTIAGPDQQGVRVPVAESPLEQDGPSGPAVAPSGRGARPSDGTEEVANLITRSHDVAATLKDLVRHETSPQGGTNRHLASMLEAAGLMSWDNAPTFEAGRLTRTRHFWLRANASELDDENYDRLVSIEGALCVNQDLGGLASTASVDECHPEVARKVFSQLSAQHIEPYDVSAALSAAYPGKGTAEVPGEWAVRARIASIAECAVTPFRVVHDHRANVAEHVAAISLEIPRPRCMAIFSTNPTVQTPLARSYALRVATLLASEALKHSVLGEEPLLTTVYVNCHERGSAETLLSIRFDRRLVSQLDMLFTSDSALESNGFPTSESIRANFGPDGWFQPVEPFLTFDDELVSPSWRFIYPELVDRPTSDQLRTVTGARTVSDLGINENAGRIAAWDSLTAEPWETTEQIVSRLKQQLFDARDITVTEACNRTIEHLLAGTVDATDKDELGHIFIAGTSLERAVAQSEEALDESDGPADPDRAVSVLSEALAPIQSLGAYLDDSDTVYRYFGSVSERIRFNLDIDDHRRAVRLVPDAYYNALANLSIAYDMLEVYDKAMAMADEMGRIAPQSIHAAMRKVRVLEHQSRIYEAADLIKSILRYASTPRDAAICHYRLAFMEWKLGREDLAVACYQRSLTWDSEMAREAREELDDLLNSDDNLHRFEEEEVVALLAKEGIPLGCDESDKRRTLAAATLCADEGIFWVARPLVGTLFSLGNDDVMMGVYHSLDRH